MARRCTDWLKTYMQYTSGLEAPDVFHFWTGVSTIAGAIRRRVWIDQGYFQWVPNFYIILVAPPGIISKTTTLSVGMKLLRNVPGITFGPNAITWQALVQSMGEASEQFLLPDASLLTMSAVTCAAGELGTLIDPHDRVQMDVLTDLWDGRAEQWKKVTKGNGSDVIENPWLNVIAATTPSWLSDNFSESAVGGGFTSRCIFVYADKKRHLIALPKQQMPDMNRLLWDDLQEDLIHIAGLAGEMQIASDAVIYITHWYEQHHTRFHNVLPSDRLIGYIARKQTHMMKVAMVLVLSERDELVIRKHDIERAAAITDTIEASFDVVFSHIGQSATGRFTQLVIDTVKTAGGHILQQHLVRNVLRVMDYKEFEIALTTAIAAGMLVKHQQGNDMYIYMVDGGKRA